MYNTLCLFCPGKGTNNSEDAIPIVKNNFMLVADGLGGSGGFAHSELYDEAIDKETSFEKMFSNVFDNLTEDNKKEVKEYFEQSLEKYFSLKTEDKKKRNCDFRSGYFASRIVATIMYGYFLQKDNDFFLKMFEDFSNADEQMLRKKEDEAGCFFADYVKKQLSKVAENGNFIYESKTSGMILLPTTLVTTIYNETDEYVDTMYLWAGDSRGYYWGKQGLIQVTNDHEIDGVMTNLINLSGNFKISCKYVRIKKPCLIFSTSDGCYSCMTSPLDFEYYFFNQFASASSYSDAQEKLKDLYVENSEDDTNTVAMKAFGFESFDELKVSIKDRLTMLNKTYEAQLPGIFTINFDVNIDALNKKIRNQLIDFDITQEPDIFEMISKITNKKIDPYKWRNELEKKIHNAKESLRDIIADNYLFIIRYLSSIGMCKELNQQKVLSKSQKDLSEHDKKQEDFVLKVEYYKMKFSTYYEDMIKILDEIKNINLSYLELEDTNKCIDELCDLLEFIDSVHSSKDIEIRNYIKSQTRLRKTSKKYADKYPEEVEKILEIIISNCFDANEFSKMVDFNQITQYKDIITQAEDKLINNRIEDNPDMKEIILYWKKNSPKILYELFKEKAASPLWKKLGEGIVDEVKEFQKNIDALEIRNRLYEEYNKSYYLIQEEEKC